MFLFYFYLIFTQIIFSTETIISSAHSLQNICYRSAAEYALISKEKKASQWLCYFEGNQKYSRNTDHQDGLIFQRQPKTKIGWFNILESAGEDICGCNFEEKYFNHERIKVKKTLYSFTTKDFIIGLMGGALFGLGGGLITQDLSVENLTNILLALPLWISIYLRKISQNRHDVFIGTINNNNRNDVEKIACFSYPYSYKNTDVLLSKNYNRDNCLCIIGNSHIKYLFKKNYPAFWYDNFNQLDPIQTAFSKSSPDITFIAIPSQRQDQYPFLLINFNNNELYIMAHTFYSLNPLPMVQTHKEENVENFSTTLGKFIAIQKDKTIQVAQIWNTRKPCISYLPGNVKDAQLIHLDEDNRSLLYFKNKSIYLQNFDYDCGILDEDIAISDEYFKKRILYPPLLALDDELPFCNPTFTLLPKKNDNNYLFFKVTDDAFPQKQSVICINTLKKTWFYLTPSEIKLLDNPWFDVKSLAKIMQEKTNNPDTVFNLYKNDERNLILKKAEVAHRKPYWITADSLVAFA